MGISQIVTWVTAAIAVYGAVLSTVTLIRGYMNDRFKLIIRCYESFVHSQSEHFSALIIEVVNAGRRPITITGIGHENLKLGMSGGPIWGMPSGDVTPKLPAYLKEQDICRAWMRSSGKKDYDIKNGLAYPYPGIVVIDGRGKKHYVDMSWKARWKRNRDRREFKKNWNKETKTTAQT